MGGGAGRARGSVSSAHQGHSLPLHSTKAVLCDLCDLCGLCDLCDLCDSVNFNFSLRTLGNERGRSADVWRIGAHAFVHLTC